MENKSDRKSGWSYERVKNSHKQYGLKWSDWRKGWNGEDLQQEE